MLRRLFILIWLSAGCGSAAQQQEATTPPPLPWETSAATARAYETPRTTITHATIFVGNGMRLDDATIVFENGRIVSVGQDAAAGEGTVIDGRGLFITPGIIDVHSHMGVYPMPSVHAHDDGNEATSPATPEVRAVDSFWPQDPALLRALSFGVTTIQVLPGSANLIGGAGETMKMHPGRIATEMLFPNAPSTMKMACGENPKRVYGERNQAPSTRMGNIAGFRRLFQSAQEYGRDWTAWQQNSVHYDSEHEAGEENAAPRPNPPARDFGRELLLGAMQGRVLIQMHCYRADEMSTMIDLGHEFGFRIRSFHHALEAYKIRDILAAEEVSVSTWSDWWGFKLEAWDTIPENIALIHESGGRAVVHSDSPSLVQRLNQEAAKALTAGQRAGIDVDENDAIRWLTANPAWTLGVQDQTGTLEVGKMADVVLWTHHPLSVYAMPQLVFVDGVLEYDRAVGDSRSDFELGFTDDGRTQPASRESTSGGSR